MRTTLPEHPAENPATVISTPAPSSDPTAPCRASAALSAAGGILILSLIYAPWALGCLPPWAVKGLAGLMSLAAVFWSLSILRRGRTETNALCLIGSLALLLQGWWMVFNAHSVYDPAHDRFNFIPAIFPSHPGAVDGRVAAAMMLQISSVLIAFVIACDLARQRIWRWRLLTTMALTGVTLAAYGILQRVGFVPAIAHSKYAESVFASFEYHGNAGAFLNLIIPAVFLLAVARKVSIASVIGLAVCLAAVLVNVSRAAMVISFAIVACLALWARRNTAIRPNIRQAKRRPITAIIIVAVLVIACAGSRELWRRWRNFPVNFQRDNPRLLMDRIAYHMARDAGWFGDGPGSFKLMFPGTRYMIPALYPRWEVLVYKPGEETNRNSYVHNDYLQFAIEWGWIGAGVWGCLLLGGLWKGWAAYNHPNVADDRPLLAAALIAMGGVLIHATVDWPLQVASLELYAAVYLAILWSSGEQCASC